MKKLIILAVVVLLANVASADTFGTGDNQFAIDFVDISGDASSANGTEIGSGKTFSDPGNDYRMGTYEITNDQWNKFQASYGTVTGDPLNAYDFSATFTGTDVPTNRLSWYEGAQFVNYLNTSTGHQAAYKFTGTQGTGDYTFSVWGSGDAGYNLSNPYRNSEAYYFLPTEDEWVKAAYWNGMSLQTYAMLGDLSPTEDVDANYHDESGAQPWNVGTGLEELNGTFDMMGNLWEWMESPYSSDYLPDSDRGIRGGAFDTNGGVSLLRSSHRSYSSSDYEGNAVGFRVASVPEPCSLVLLSLGGLFLRKRRV